MTCLSKTFVIKGSMPSMNEYIDACRKDKHYGAKLKKTYQSLVCRCIRECMPDVHFDKPVTILYRYCEANKRRDHDNVHSFAAKVIQDALVECGVLDNDGWKNITGFVAVFEHDKDSPAIHVTITEDCDGE